MSRLRKSLLGTAVSAAGIVGGADLVPGTHGWADPVVVFIVTRTA